MNKRNFTTISLEQGEMHVYDFGSVKLHAYQTGDPLSDEVFLVEKAGQFNEDIVRRMAAEQRDEGLLRVDSTLSQMRQAHDHEPAV